MTINLGGLERSDCVSNHSFSHGVDTHSDSHSAESGPEVILSGMETARWAFRNVTLDCGNVRPH